MLEQQDYVTLLNDALRRNETVIIACNCSIRYSGRAESLLEDGDRVIIIKADNTLLVHQPSGNNPINYMKQNTTHTLVLTDKKMTLQSRNLALKENMDITINKMYFFNSQKLEDGRSIVISGTEADMAKMLYENPEMIEKGFAPVSQEEQTKYGFIDVLGVDKDGMLTVVECKRYSADLGAVTQLRRYVERLMVSKGISKVRGIIAAPKITPNAHKMLEDWGYSFVSVKPPKYLEDFNKKQSRLDNF
ncbi:endonuclease NucS [Candidatus Woesearchaeota archaeon]|nr:endonuclease NucS [Candidatus Woesearchaeota archaeon]MBW3005182.1 endonuclease NucS [Candidatus Woesearchaeota archaeon]